MPLHIKRGRLSPLRCGACGGPGKIGYVLGDFAPDSESAEAILEYTVHHAESEHGKVAYANWPAGVKGHFIVRVPPEGKVAT